MYTTANHEPTATRADHCGTVTSACVAGDDVLQWNGVPLQNRSAEEVAAVVADSKHDSHVELLVSRPLPAARPHAQPWRTHKGLSLQPPPIPQLCSDI